VVVAVYYIYTEFMLAETANHLRDIIIRALGFAEYRLFTGLFSKRELQIYHIYTEFLLAETANHLGDIIVRALGFAKRHDEHFVVIMQRVLGRCRHFITHSVELLPYCVAECCSVQCVAVCCSVLQWVAVGCSVCCSVFQCLAVCSSVVILQRVLGRCRYFVAHSVELLP